MRNTHLYTGIFLVPLCLYCLFWLIPNNIVPPTSEHDISPGLIPYIAVGAGLVMSFLMAFRALKERFQGTDEMDDEFGTEATGIDPQVLVNVIIWGFSSTVVWFLMVHVGFEPAMSVLLVGTMLYIGVRRVMPIVANSIVMPILLSQAAWYFFTTEMPAIWR